MRTCPKCYRKVSEQSTCSECGFNVVTGEQWTDVQED